MTTVDPRLVTEINQVEVPCQMRDAQWQPCGDPAAWIVTWTARRAPRPFIDHVPTCIVHLVALEQHRTHCDSCTAAFDVKAAEL